MSIVRFAALLVVNVVLAIIASTGLALCIHMMKSDRFGFQVTGALGFILLSLIILLIIINKTEDTIDLTKEEEATHWSEEAVTAEYYINKPEDIDKE